VLRDEDANDDLDSFGVLIVKDGGDVFRFSVLDFTAVVDGYVLGGRMCGISAEDITDPLKCFR